MKMTFKISNDHEIQITENENGTITANSLYRVSGDLWSYNFKDFSCIEDAITFYQIKF